MDSIDITVWLKRAPWFANVVVVPVGVFSDDLAGDLLWRVLDVAREPVDGLVDLASARRVRGLEGFVVVVFCYFTLVGHAVRDRPVLAIDVLVRVEDSLGLGTLREWLVLQLAQVVLTLFMSNLLGHIVLVWHVRNLSTERSVSSNLAILRRVGQEVAWPRHDIALLILEVLLNFHAASLVRIGRFNRLFDSLGWFEIFVVTRCQVAVLHFSPAQVSRWLSEVLTY